MKVVVTSHNPVKINSVQSGFEACFKNKVQVLKVNVSSDVSDQPETDEETLKGAYNRAKNGSHSGIEADFYVGIEGGVQEVNGQLMAFAWIVITNGDQFSKAKTGSFLLPPRIAELIKEGAELGEADDKVFKKKNSKQQNGAVGLLTNDMITRESLYHQAVVLALIPFQNQSLYFQPGKVVG